MLAAKQYTETILTSLLLDAPIMRRAYTKPLGYPGDYQVMLYYYNNTFEGDSLFGRIFHKLGVEHPLSNGVRTRKDFIVDIMEREHQRILAASGERAVYRVASLGCGPAREVSDYVARKGGWPGQVVWTLIDQEEEALSVAFAATKSALSRCGGNGRLQCLNVSFAQLLTGAPAVPIADRQHLFFATGLIDYLRESVAQTLLQHLYDDLEEGGLLAIGNAIAPTEEFWSPEFVLDWTLLYRTRDEMLRLATRLPASAEVEVVVEPGRAYYFLLVRKH
jgi:extracellular factor (EF) 3-hydroxypalmitic acid methyl ester biosynthesis protein